MLIGNHRPLHCASVSAELDSCRRVLFPALAAITLLATIAGPLISFPSQAAASAPFLSPLPNQTRAAAVNSVPKKAEPFPPAQTPTFSVNGALRRRVILLPPNLPLAAGENVSAATADAEDGAHIH